MLWPYKPAPALSRLNLFLEHCAKTVAPSAVIFALLVAPVPMVACETSSRSSENSAEDSGGLGSDAPSFHAAGRSIKDRWSACHPPDPSKGAPAKDTVVGSFVAIREAYDLETIGEHILPLVIEVDTGTTTELLSQTLVLETDGTYRSTVRYRFRKSKSQYVRSFVETGHYRQDPE